MDGASAPVAINATHWAGSATQDYNSLAQRIADQDKKPETQSTFAAANDTSALPSGTVPYHVDTRPPAERDLPVAAEQPAATTTQPGATSSFDSFIHRASDSLTGALHKIEDGIGKTVSSIESRFEGDKTKASDDVPLRDVSSFRPAEMGTDSFAEQAEIKKEPVLPIDEAATDFSLWQPPADVDTTTKSKDIVDFPSVADTTDDSKFAPDRSLAQQKMEMRDREAAQKKD